jgi:hypothetical protein
MQELRENTIINFKIYSLFKIENSTSLIDSKMLKNKSSICTVGPGY